MLVSVATRSISSPLNLSKLILKINQMQMKSNKEKPGFLLSITGPRCPTGTPDSTICY